ncbi:MAG: DUF2306 domain-containing protein [Methyloligellaceae bacterium]
MSLDPLLKSQIFIIIHAFAAMFALLVGIAQFIGVKGTTVHRVLGWGWVIAMMIVALSSFQIREINQLWGFSWIHILSVVVLFNVPLAVIAAKSHNIPTHKYTMMGVYIGGLLIAGFFTLMPGRIMHQVVFGS